jgi:hypothetical protein
VQYLGKRCKSILTYTIWPPVCSQSTWVYNIMLKYHTGRSCCWKYGSVNQVFGPWTIVYLLDLTHLVENDISNSIILHLLYRPYWALLDKI